MLLRASSTQEGQPANLQAVTDTAESVGLPFEDIIGQMVEALLSGSLDDLDRLRDRADEEMGVQTSTDALTVACGFNGITRVADATGIPLDANTEATTQELRTSTGIDAFDYANKSKRYLSNPI